MGAQGQGGAWVHVVVVVKKPLLGATAYTAGQWLGNFVSIFCNGHRETTGGTTFSNDWTPKPVGGDVIIGKGPFDASTLDTYFNNFKIHSLAIWNTDLAADEIQSIYEAAIQYEGSGIITNPPRDYLQKMDNRGGRYPTIKSIGDPRRIGKKTPFFDDTKTRIFWKFTPLSPDLSTYSYLSSWQINNGEAKWNVPTWMSGSLKFLAFLSASKTYSETFAESSLNHPPHTGSFPLQKLARATTYSATTGPIFNTTGSNSFVIGSSGPYQSDCIAFTTMNVTESAGTVSNHVYDSGAALTIAGLIPDGISRYKDGLSFVKRGGTDPAYWDRSIKNPYIDGTTAGPADTLALVTNATLDPNTPFTAGTAVSGYNKYLENTPQTISVWVNPSVDYLAGGSMTILSKGFWSMQHGEYGGLSGSGTIYSETSSPNVLAESAYEYRLRLTASAPDKGHYEVIFEVGLLI